MANGHKEQARLRELVDIVTKGINGTGTLVVNEDATVHGIGVCDACRGGLGGKERGAVTIDYNDEKGGKHYYLVDRECYHLIRDGEFDALLKKTIRTQQRGKEALN